MDFGTILFWSICLSCLPALFRGMIRPGSIGRGWIVVYLVVLTITATGAWQQSDLSVYAGGALWTSLVLVPAILSHVYVRSVLQQRFGLAQRVAQVMRALHPADGWREQPQIARALKLAHQDKLAAAIELLQHHRNANGQAALTAVANLHRLTNQWEEFLAWRQAHIPDLRADLSFLSMTLRALGETGDLTGLIQTYERHKTAIARLEPAVQRNFCRLMLFAFWGERAPVERLFRGSLLILPVSVQRFWLATADRAAGRHEDAQRELHRLAQDTDPTMRRAAEFRLARRPARPEEHATAHARQLIASAREELDQEERFGAHPRLFSRRARATQILLALNLVVFLREIQKGGSTDAAVLYQLGGLVPQAVREGEWWRPATAIFLHYGFLHLLMNMLALWALGPLVEFALGFRRFGALYFLAGIGSMLAVVGLATGSAQQTLTVGASGCVMGVVGATGAIMLKGWRREKARVAWRRFVAVLMILILQTAFDWVVPEVSMTAHLSGALIGFASALFFKNRLSGIESSAG